MLVGTVHSVVVFSWIRESLKKLKVTLLVKNSRVTSSGSGLYVVCDCVVLPVEMISKVSL